MASPRRLARATSLDPEPSADGLQGLLIRRRHVPGAEAVLTFRAGWPVRVVFSDSRPSLAGARAVAFAAANGFRRITEDEL
jgi:hypothetical protein